MEKPTCNKTLINNDFYETLNDAWHSAEDHPIALLRAENRVRAPWIAQEIQSRFKNDVNILDIGCGGGLLSNHLALEGYNVTGIDISQNSIETAKKYDTTKKVHYLEANAYNLPFKENSFNVVCAMDILEHVDNPALLIQQASRVLQPGGVCFFHTFNRNIFSKLLVIYGVDYFVKNAPKNMHVYPLFIKPKELGDIFHKENMIVEKFVGLTPSVWNKAFWKMVLSGKVSDDFKFHFSKSLLTGYCGIAQKGVGEMKVIPKKFSKFATTPTELELETGKSNFTLQD